MMKDDEIEEMDEVATAYFLRSLDTVVNAWDSDDLSTKEMTRHLESLVEVWKGRSDYQDFVKKCNLKETKSN